MANNVMENLKLIVWKQSKLKYSRWFYTALELLPILLVFLICREGSRYIHVTDSGKPKTQNATINPVVNVSTLMKSHSPRYSYIYYVPNHPNISEIVHSALSKLGDGNLPSEGFDNEYTMLKKINGSADILGIVFDHVQENHKKEKITYKFETVNTWNTGVLFYRDKDENVHGPIKDDLYYNTGYAALQLAINKVLLEQYYLPGSNVNFNKVSIQAFPYPEYVKVDPSIRDTVPSAVNLLLAFMVFITSLPLITTIIEEKQNGVKELMKIVGMQEWIIWVGWFLHAFVITFFTFTIVTILVKYEFSGPGSAALRNIDSLLLWCFIILYCLANIAFCFTFTAIFHNSTVALTIYFFLPFLINYSLPHIYQIINSSILNDVINVIPLVAFGNGFHQIAYCEFHDIQLNWENISFYDHGDNSSSLATALVMLIFDVILYFFLAYYIGAINPGNYGVAKSPFFLLQKLKKKLNDEKDGTRMQELINKCDPIDGKFFEAPKENAIVSIEIRDLHKNFNMKPSVNGLNLKIYKGEILALLGHNGAGKTTTLNILTGVIEPSDGSIKAGNLDVLNEMSEFRKELGVCPQEDRLISYLSVKQHLWFFGKLKGKTDKEVMSEADEYMSKMDMLDKADAKVSNLSGGMKRKLCLAIALMGKAKILILDEPTSGLDVQSRRKVWDMLKDLKKDRTIILTTHHMEEADDLGDHITILHHGILRCWGEPEFLKKCYETGYKVTVTKTPVASFNRIDELLMLDGNDTSIKESTFEGSLEKIYSLPLDKTDKFEKLFKKVEEESDDAGIKHISVACTTLEQVFLKAGGFSVYDRKCLSRQNSRSEPDSNLPHSVGTSKTGLLLYLQQLEALMCKKWLYTSRNRMLFMMRIVLTTFIVWFIMQGSDKIKLSGEPISLTMALYEDTSIMRQKPNSINMQESIDDTFYRYISKYNGERVIISEDKTIVDGLLNIGRHDLAKYLNDVIFATNFSQTAHILLYNRYAIHSLPVIIDAYTNSLLSNNNISAEITFINSPILHTEQKNVDSDYANKIVVWFIVLVYFTMDLASFFTSGLNAERVDGFKHIQLMSNLSPVVYWLSNLLFDVLIFTLIVIIRLIGIKILGGNDDFLTFDNHLGILALIVIVYIIAALLCSYVLSYLSSSKSESYVLILVMNLLGCFLALVYYFFVIIGSDPYSYEINSFWIVALGYLVHLTPPLNYVLTFVKFFNIWFHNWKLKALKFDNADEERQITAKTLSYLEYTSPENPNGLLGEVYFMIGDIVLYAAILALIQLGILEKLSNFLLLQFYKYRGTVQITEFSGEDDDVKNEKKDVDQIVSRNPRLGIQNYPIDGTCDYVSVPQIEDSSNGEALISYHLKKNFTSWLRPLIAVQDVTFKVNAGECFGLLGVNGAGKSTTFKMLTSEILPTYGSSWISGHWLNRNKSSYLSKTGYCSQSNCFLSELTSRELLTLMAKLRGVYPDRISGTVDKWLYVLGLEDYQNQRCGTYSGGNKRKICTAMSLIGDPLVVFLDEPTTGVDPESRNKLYSVMVQSKRAGQTVVLTSHSMEECENLCDRLTIMVKGKMKCIGTVQHLKKQYTKGFSVLIKLNDQVADNAILQLKSSMDERFRCVLKDEHKTQLYYQIVDTAMRWSELFSGMEYVKNYNKVAMKDYTVTDTSLEEVFIGFAKMSSESVELLEC